MITLREFLKMIGGEQYRIYQPNRDCLIFESYFKVHSPYYFDKKHDKKREWFNHDYWDNNDYCRDVYTEGWKDPAYDEETKIFLNKYGDYEVFSVECASFKPTKMYKGEDGQLKFESPTDPRQPNVDYMDCFNIFISNYDKDHQYWGCDACYHSLLKGKKARKSKPDPKDIECKNCWRYKNGKRTRDK